MTKRTPQIETAILEGFADGRSILSLCREHGISRSTFQKWKRGDPDFARRYGEMQGEHADALVDDCMEIADNPTSYWAGCGTRDGPRDGDHIRHARLRIDARLRIARYHLRRHETAVAKREAEEAEKEPRRAETEPETKAKTKAKAEPYPDIVELLNAAHEKFARGEDPYIPPPSPAGQPRHTRSGAAT